MKRILFSICVAAIGLSVPAYGEMFQQNGLAFDYPAGYTITQDYSEGRQVVVCSKDSSLSTVVLSQVHDARIALLDNSILDEDMFTKIGNSLTNGESYRSVKVGKPHKAQLQYLSGMQSFLQVETNQEKIIEGLFFCAIKDENLLTTVALWYSDEAKEELRLIVNSTRLGKEALANEKEEEDEVVFIIVETMPEFPGGQQALFKFLSENVKYPTIAYENGIEGRVICQFVVEKDGTIANVEVVQSGGDASLDKEAVRVLKSMPRWKPGKQKGKPVRVKYTVPVNFRIERTPSKTNKP